MDVPAAPLPPSEHVLAWTRVGVVAAYLAAVASVAQGVLYLLDSSGVLEPLVGFEATAAGLQADLASYYVAFHERQHRLWWNVALRDTVGPLGALALVVLALAVKHVVGPGRPSVELAVLFVGVGALTAAVCDIAFLSQIAAWRGGGFAPSPDIVAFGRASEVLEHAISYVLHAAYAVLALGFVCFGAVLRSAGPSFSRLSVLAWCEAAALLAVVVFRVLGLGVAYDVATAMAGVVLGPVLAVCMGRALPRLAAVSASAPPETRVRPGILSRRRF